MTLRIQAELPSPIGLIDLFPGQELAVEDANLIATRLVGPDFQFEVTAQPVDLLANQMRMKAQLILPPVAVLGESPLALEVELPLERKSGTTYLVHGLDALEGLIPDLKNLNGIVISKGMATLRLGLDPWRLKLAGTPALPVASIALPGLDGIAFKVTRLEIDASGVTDCQAMVEPGRVKIGNLALQVSEGTLVLRGGQVEARLQTRFELEYFRGASVELQLVVTGSLAMAKESWVISGLTRVANNVPWSDPSGMLSFDQMVVTVDFKSDKGTFTSAVRINGRLTFLPRNLGADADAWFGRLFSGMTVSFENIELDAAIGLPVGSFSPPESLHLRAFEIFDMRVPKLAFSKSGVSLIDAVLRFEAGGAVVSGSVGAINIRLEGEPHIDLSMGEPSIAIELAAPGGFKGQASLRQFNEANVQAVRGEGRISSPALGAVEATFHIGRFRERDDAPWYPAVSLMAAQEDVNVTLFPGVVATRIELGAGINRRVVGVTGLSLAEGQRRLQDGLPDVFRQESWEDSRTDLCVVARVFAEPSQTKGDQALSLYVADMTLLMTSDLQFAAFGKLWLYTRRADAKSADFQKSPSVVGLAMFDVLQPSLRIVAMTRPDGRSSLTRQIPAGQLLGMQIPRSQLAFEASPSNLTVALGPLDIGTALGPLNVAGSTSFVLRSAGGNVYAISRSSLSAVFKASTGNLNIGLATLSGSVSAGFSATLALMGAFSDGRLTVYGLAHASCSVELALHVRIGFRISVSVGFASVEISWHEDWDFGLKMHVDLDLEAALTSDDGVGIDGRARISVNVLGISASLSLHIAADSGLVAKGREVYKNVVVEVDKLLGATT
ncbi:hypothetical protein HU751_005170 [Pseudomonas sp. BW13M1]|uniref:Uncharacterized protein n=1 Tax=Pseudomonas peradeniyensis TaxID=2745488 RepID=A0A923GE99_9PSED|nr:hypothetical protein [Pseudomonas peradeniyensis]MBV4504231.1 hypothetical protein [Pseudomonas peradeniyensis]